MCVCGGESESGRTKMRVFTSLGHGVEAGKKKKEEEGRGVGVSH